MKLADILARIDSLKKELDELRPIKPEDELRIMQKFRLDWNYHSNNIEGNKLTYGETKALILFGTTAQGKPLKDSLEVKGHDEAIKLIEEVIKEERPLIETFIREMHEVILKEPYEVDAITPEGKPTKRRVHIGKYKTVPNHVKTKTGEIFRFATPEETPAKMEDLLKWYKKDLNKEEEHPLIFASEFHYRFIRIHPFDDGNGRMARILMNFILMQKGYPPIIIRTNDKEDKYFPALEQADAGDLEPFFEYLGEELVHSLEIMISGAKGENIEEPDDLDKKIGLLKKRLDKKKGVKVVKSNEVLSNLYDDSISPLIHSIIDKQIKFADFFMSLRANIDIRCTNGETYSTHHELTPVEFLKTLNEIYNNGSFFFTNTSGRPIGITNKPFEIGKVHEIDIDVRFVGFNKDNTNAFHLSYTYIIKLEEYSYKIRNNNTLVNKLYDENLSKEEITRLANSFANKVYEDIEFKIGLQ